ncbi:MAG: LapA family protein [Luminiphilus sp.]|jgi:putative membrane protein|nr:LapA family protein [Halieaceae bacterium]MDG1799891.1 LapA family protein [Luminiphilus sp.]
MLQWLRAALILAMLSLSIFLGAVFATQNTEAVPLTLGTISLSEQSVAVWLLGFLVVGVLIGQLISSVLLLQQRGSLAVLKRENTKLKRRIEQASADG